MYISDHTLDQFIKEDVPYLDLTTWVLGIGGQIGTMKFFTREDAVLCGSEEVSRILSKLGIAVDSTLPTGSLLRAGDVFITAHGQADALHTAWKACQNIVDHCSGIATKTKLMVDKAKSVNPHITIVTTRKGFPGTKELSIKSILAGGAFPHRLGLSETILVFKQHLNFIGGLDGFIEQIPKIKQKACEKKLIVEAESVEDAVRLCTSGVEGIQFDKLTPAQLKDAVIQLKAINPHVALLAAGGVNETNIAQYAETSVDAIVTTSLYSAKPIDMGVKIEIRS